MTSDRPKSFLFNFKISICRFITHGPVLQVSVSGFGSLLLPFMGANYPSRRSIEAANSTYRPSREVTESVAILLEVDTPGSISFGMLHQPRVHNRYIDPSTEVASAEPLSELARYLGVDGDH